MQNQVTALVVETNFLIAASIEFPLTSHGFRVVVATNDTEARNALATESVQIAIIDFRLQHADADGLVARLQAAGIPHVFCTAATREEVLEHFPDARIIEKPFLDAGLMSMVTSVMAERQARCRPC